jgi:CubicO group peptidase (beta-lactamase class C family)
LKSVLKWAAFAVVVLAVLVIARDPQYWTRRIIVGSSGGELPPSFYSPRATIHGSNRPPAPHENAIEEKLDTGALESAAAYAEKQHSRALIVTRHGYLVFERYWQSSNPDTVVESTGLGRVVAALATGAAIADHKIGWPDEPAGYLVPAWNSTVRGQVTVRQLLQHDADPDVLGYVVQSATGKPYAQYISEAIWGRIGAGDASIWLQSDGAPHVDTGFFARQGDWLRVGELLLGNGNYQGDEVFLPRWVPELLKPNEKRPDYGSYLRLGLHAAPGMSPYASPDVFVVEGGGNRMWLVPSLQLAILRTGGALEPDWDDGRIPNLIINGTRDFVPPATRPGAADLRLLVPNH